MAARLPDRTVEAIWDAAADAESGIKAFLLERDGKEDLAQWPEKPAGKYGRPLFQAMSYLDTLEKPLPEMRFMDTTAQKGVKHKYRIITVSSGDVKSAPSKATTVR